jgi:DNA-binding transcriptional LysR family regulator
LGITLGRRFTLEVDHPGVELDWLETFLAVVDCGGFTAASEHVHRSQSRVSAHIAGLERELGVRLIDRTRRPATVTPAGQVLARHAREIVAGVGSARSAVGALRAMGCAALSVLTTPCIGCSLFPGVIAELADRHPGVRITLTEQSRDEIQRSFPVDGVVAAVLPTLPHPLAPGLQELLLWREPIQLVVNPDHELARLGKPVPIDDLVQLPLIVCGSAAEPEVRQWFAARSYPLTPRVLVDTPQSLVAMARVGIGVGIANAVALAHADTSGLIVLDIDDPDLVREVAAYWYEVLASTGIGASLLRTLRAAPAPPGAIEPRRSPGRPVIR